MDPIVSRTCLLIVESADHCFPLSLLPSHSVMISRSFSAHSLATLASSSVHYYSHGANGIFKIQAPMVLGHEASGIVTALPSVLPPGSTLKVGDKVALEVGVYCKICKYCKIGRYNLCSGMRFASSAKTFPHLDGTLTEVMCHPVDLLHK